MPGSRDRATRDIVVQLRLDADAVSGLLGVDELEGEPAALVGAFTDDEWDPLLAAWRHEGAVPSSLMLARARLLRSSCHRAHGEGSGSAVPAGGGPKPAPQPPPAKKVKVSMVIDPTCEGVICVGSAAMQARWSA